MDTLVLIIEYGVKPTDPNIGRLLNLFSVPPFNPIVFTPSQTTNFNAMYREALLFAASGPFTMDEQGQNLPTYQYQNSPCLLILANSVSNLNSSQLVRYLAAAISYQPDFVFLNQWNDSCNKYKTIQASIANGPALKQTFDPNSTQANWYTPSSRDLLINSLSTSTLGIGSIFSSILETGTTKGLCFVPSLISADINLITSNSDFIKLNECRIVANVPPKSSRSFALVLFILIVIFVLFIAIALIKISPESPKVES